MAGEMSGSSFMETQDRQGRPAGQVQVAVKNADVRQIRCVFTYSSSERAYRGMVFLGANRPPVVSMEIRRWALDDPEQPRVLRASLRQALTHGPDPVITGDDDVLHRVVLVATELASNAIRHAVTPLSVRLGHGADCLVLVVADRDPLVGPRYAPDRPVGRGGLGLQLVREMATDAGWYIDGTSKHVWATFPLPAT